MPTQAHQPSLDNYLEARKVELELSQEFRKGPILEIDVGQARLLRCDNVVVDYSIIWIE